MQMCAYPFIFLLIQCPLARRAGSKFPIGQFWAHSNTSLGCCSHREALTAPLSPAALRQGHSEQMALLWGRSSWSSGLLYAPVADGPAGSSACERVGRLSGDGERKRRPRRGKRPSLVPSLLMAQIPLSTYLTCAGQALCYSRYVGMGATVQA